MYSLLQELLSDKKGGLAFSCFGLWHWCYIIAVSVVAAFFICYLKNKSFDIKRNIIKAFINLSFGLYIADFFLMPLAYGEIDIEKLPFHACTAMCVACFLSNHIKALEKFRWNFALLGFISNLVYLIYPAGVMWYQVHPLSYRVVQTLVFHGFMSVYGLLVLVFESRKVHIKKCYRDLIVLACMSLWALLGNSIYNGDADGYSHFFNWFFVLRDPFYILPEKISPFIMPILNIAVFFTVEMIIYLVFVISKRININKEKQINE